MPTFGWSYCGSAVVTGMLTSLKTISTEHYEFNDKNYDMIKKIIEIKDKHTIEISEPLENKSYKTPQDVLTDISDTDVNNKLDSQKNLSSMLEGIGNGITIWQKKLDDEKLEQLKIIDVEKNPVEYKKYMTNSLSIILKQAMDKFCKTSFNTSSTTYSTIRLIIGR